MKTCRFYGKECGCNCDGHDESCEIFVPLTNADRIRSMSDEELAKFLHIEVPEWCGCPPNKDCAAQQNCTVCYQEWLKQEVSE